MPSTARSRKRKRFGANLTDLDDSDMETSYVASSTVAAPSAADSESKNLPDTSSTSASSAFRLRTIPNHEIPEKALAALDGPKIEEVQQTIDSWPKHDRSFDPDPAAKSKMVETTFDSMHPTSGIPDDGSDSQNVPDTWPAPDRFFDPDPATGSQMAQMSFDSMHPTSGWIQDNGSGSLNVLRIIDPSDRLLAAIDANKPRDAMVCNYFILRNMDDRTRDLNDKVKGLENQASTMNDRVANCEERARMAVNTADTTKKFVSGRFDDLKDLRFRIEELEEQRNSVEIDIAAHDASPMAQGANCAGDYTVLKKEALRVQSLVNLESLIAKTYQEIHNKEHTEHKAKHAILKSDHAVLKSEHAVLKNEHAALKNEHTALEGKHTALEGKHALLKSKQTLLEKKHAALESDFKDLRAKDAEREPAVKSLKFELKALKQLMMQHASLN